MHCRTSSSLPAVPESTAHYGKEQKNLKSIWPKSFVGTLMQILMNAVRWWWSFRRESAWTDAASHARPRPLINTGHYMLETAAFILSSHEPDRVLSDCIHQILQHLDILLNKYWPFLLLKINISLHCSSFVFFWPWIACITTRGQASTHEMMSLRPWTQSDILWRPAVCLHMWSFMAFLQTVSTISSAQETVFNLPLLSKSPCLWDKHYY